MNFATGVRFAAVSVSLMAHAALMAVATPHEPTRPMPRDTAPASQLVEFTNVTRVGDDAVVAAAAVAPAPSARVVATSTRAPRVKTASTAPPPSPPTTKLASAAGPATHAASTSVSIAHFTLAPSSQWSASLAMSATTPKATAPQPDHDIVSEHDVSTRAKLLSAAEVTYPTEARAAELEADIPVEIVVDAKGAVADARALSRTGFGLDAAAVRAIRGYRFEPAKRDGHRVAVRMRWQVSFRLR